MDMGSSKQRLGPSRRNTVLRSGNVLCDGETGRATPTFPTFDGSVLDDLVRCRQPGASPAFAITSSARAAVAATWMSCTVDVWEAQAKMWVPWRGAMLGRCDAEGLAGHDHGAMLLLESQPISPVTTRGWQFQRSGLDSQLASTSR